ncbi:MAG: NADH-quinone oxidoreductase subunit J [Verrucomicrobia bacterium]|nr:NADH-quinone oxidoreductase subunit J [Verrucomicrobiota bacterium]MDA1006128.1 NADH-quinone oxidoreductase subunit J [Verrucomicrobiota bacterium]
MPSIAFYIFSLIAVTGAVALVAFRNPVSSAMAMTGSFIGLAALFVGLNAYFVGIIQILVYAGAIMVLFLFIIMLLDLKSEERSKPQPLMLAACLVIPILFLVQLTGVLQSTKDEPHKPLNLVASAKHFERAEGEQETIIHQNLAKEELPDVHLIGLTLFTRYNFPLQVVGVLLLVATIGVVSLSKRGSDRPAKPSTDS